MIEDYIAKAVADSTRPDADRARDALRKPAEVLSFAGVKPGMTVAEWFPDGGYFTRMISRIVGPAGKVYAIEIKEFDTGATGRMAAEPGRENVSVHFGAFGAFAPPEQVDLVWTTQNYHDLHVAEYGATPAAFNERVHAALKPGGTYIVLDHQADAGTDDARIAKLHRIEKAVVIQEVVASGFVLAGDSEVLRTDADDHSRNSADAAIKGHTDQFLLRFQKI